MSDQAIQSGLIEDAVETADRLTVVERVEPVLVIVPEKHVVLVFTPSTGLVVDRDWVAAGS